LQFYDRYVKVHRARFYFPKEEEIL